MEAMIEILMATYNGKNFLREQIDSIVNQSDRNWHLTISDDGSDDGTTDIIDEYAHRYPEKISRHFSGQRFGNARDHFFHLMRQCAADWMLFCDQDDTWFSSKIAKMRAAMIAAEEEGDSQTPILVFSDQVPTDAQLHPLAPSLMRYQKQYFEHFDYRSILMQNVVTGGAMGINRALAKLAGQCTDTSQVIMHDWWFAAVAARFGKIVYLDEPMGTYRQHEGNTTGAKNVDSINYIHNQTKKLKAVQSMIQRKKNQARGFQNTYQAVLKEEDLAFLKEFEKKKSGFKFYWKYNNLLHGITRKAGMMLLG